MQITLTTEGLYHGLSLGWKTIKTANCTGYSQGKAVLVTVKEFSVIINTAFSINLQKTFVYLLH